jgi:uncharacterized protein (DUF1015 family)
MARLLPFRALRPPAEVAGRVAAVPYDVVSAEEARASASGNPLSFLRVSRAEIDLPPDTDPHTDQVYGRAAANFVTLRRDAPLVQERVPALYVYRLRMGAHVQTGVAGSFSVDEYERDVIRKHERTRRDKEDDRTRHVLALRAQTGPVFLTYRASDAVDAVVRRTTATPATLCDFTAPDGVHHAVWRVDPAGQADLGAAFASVETLYIADGHHRAASAARARARLRAGGGGGEGEWDWFLAVAFPDNQVQILPYNRTVKDLGGLTADALLARLAQVLTVGAGRAVPASRGEVAMFLAGRWYSLALAAAPADASPADRLDVSRLQDTVLGPILGIGDVRSDTRIDFVGGGRGTGELERLVTSGRAAVAFSLHPVGVDELMAISDAGGIMPPKSTWFEPKLRDGLLSHLI